MRKDSADNPVHEAVRRPFFRGSRAVLLLAACFILALVLVGTLALRLRRQSQETERARNEVAQLQNREKELQSRLGELEQARAELLKTEREKSDKLEAERNDLKNQVAELQKSQLNIPVYSKLLTEERGTGEPLMVIVPPAARSVMLRLRISKPNEYPQYLVELIDAQGNTVREAAGLKPVDDGTLNLIIPRSALGEGKYLVRVHGQRGKVQSKVAEDDLLLTRSK
ncbi:MAG TPA: hypothetical protein VFD58_09180 [Blastocatellia bacterium]|nr:hypothetical protein [Blastocatellia bacterium]